MTNLMLNKRIQHIKIPNRMSNLPVSDEGFPVPWFVQWIDGKPDFRVVDIMKLKRAMDFDRCWLCGDQLGKYKSFVIGPMCAVNRISAEPPSHHECARYAVEACPFLSQPKMRRNEKELPLHKELEGVMLKRNPGVSLIWTVKEYKVFRGPGGGPLFNVGEPWGIESFCQGRKATFDETLESINSGYPLLLQMAEEEGMEATILLKKKYDEAVKLIQRLASLQVCG